MMIRFEFPVDVRNPGHFFACCGILDAADRFLSTAKGYFSNGAFVIETEDGEPLKTIIDHIVPSNKQEIKNTIRSEDDNADSVLYLDSLKIRMDFWKHFDDRPSMKLFAGQASGKGIVERWLNHLYDIKDDEMLSKDPFAIFVYDLPSGFDSSTAWNALDIGFSLNLGEKYNKKIKTCPIVEFFAHIGVQTYAWSRDKTRSYVYNTWSKPLPILIAKAVACGALNLDGSRHFKFEHKMSGQTKILKRAKEIFY